MTAKKACDEVFVLHDMDYPEEDAPRTVVVALPVLKRSEGFVHVERTAASGYRMRLLACQFYETMEEAVDAYAARVFKLKMAWVRAAEDLKEMRRKAK